MLIEAATGASLHDQLRRHIIEPLALTATSLPHGSDPAIEGPHSRHYTKLFDSSPDAAIHDATELDVLGIADNGTGQKGYSAHSCPAKLRTACSRMRRPYTGSPARSV